MADPMTLDRAFPSAHGFSRDGLSMTPEPFVNLQKSQIHGGSADTVLSVALGAAAPRPGKSVSIDGIDCAWLAPGEWLLSGNSDALDDLASRIGAHGEALYHVTSLTHARVSFKVSGSQARDALAAHCPLDLSESRFAIGDGARSLLGDARLFLQRLDDRDDTPQFRIIVDQTMAAYAMRMLAGPDRKR